MLQCGCIGASPLSQFDFFSLPMIKLCDIFSLDCSAIKQQVPSLDNHSICNEQFSCDFWPCDICG